MSLHAAINELNGLNIKEKLILLETLWADLSESPEQIPVPDWHKKELDSRMAEHEQNPDDLLTWDEVKSRIKYHKE